MNNMKNSIKRAQSQACLNFAERKNFRLKAKNKILMTLALLLTAVTGAWAQDAEPAITVEWNPATKTGTFTMPAFDVEIAPIYAPTAQWAKVENVDQLPKAIEGIFAESTDAIVKAGTVAKIGGTENPQGTVMYFATTDAEMTAEKAAKADGWLADPPTAEKIAAGDVYVWYYIKGADTPDGQEATAENTFNDSEICATPLTVTVLNNKFDINFNAANDNTIEAGKATVTVGGTAATFTEGKLEGVKMGSEVKMTAKEGYKFRKVEAKKGGATVTPKLYSFTITGPFTGNKLVVEFYEGDTWNDMITKYPSTLKKIRDKWVGFSTDGCVTDPITEKWVEVTDQLVPNRAYYVE